MKVNFSEWGPLTVLAVVVVTLVTVALCVMAVVGTITADEFVLLLTKLAQALGLGVAVGRGVHLGLARRP
jgi:hypothetical protein